MEANQTISDTKQFIIVRVGNNDYGIDIKYVDNIIVMQGITRVPKAQSYYKGVINLRGEIIPVMSLLLRFGMEETQYTEENRIVIVKPEGQGAGAVGVIVDEVKEVVALSQSDIESIAHDENDSSANFNIGVGKMGEDLITILNIVGVVIEKAQVINN